MSNKIKESNHTLKSCANALLNTDATTLESANLETTIFLSFSQKLVQRKSEKRRGWVGGEERIIRHVERVLQVWVRRAIFKHVYVFRFLTHGYLWREN